MGFTYIEGGRGQRDGWTFRYTGAELAPRARAKAAALLEEERGLERAFAACKAGGAYSGRKEDLARFRQRLRDKGEQRERCELLARELERAADRVFELGLGDLVYFGMDEGITASGDVAASGRGRIQISRRCLICQMRPWPATSRPQGAGNSLPSLPLFGACRVRAGRFSFRVRNGAGGCLPHQHRGEAGAVRGGQSQQRRGEGLDGAGSVVFLFAGATTGATGSFRWRKFFIRRTCDGLFVGSGPRGRWFKSSRPDLL
jgi:hypothetical protein